MAKPIPVAADLQPCPFCGGRARMWHQQKNNRETTLVRCDNSFCLTAKCGIGDKRADREADAAKEWNTRATLTAAQQQGQAVADPIAAIQTFARAYKAEVPNAELTVHGIDAGLRAVAQPMQQGGGEVVDTLRRIAAGLRVTAANAAHEKYADACRENADLLDMEAGNIAIRAERTAPPSAELAEIAGWINGELQDWLRIGGSETFGDIVSRQLHKWHEEHARRGELLKEALAQQPAAIPRLANCGRYTATDNTGEHYYLNHANTWQTFQGQQPAAVDEARVVETIRKALHHSYGAGHTDYVNFTEALDFLATHHQEPTT